MWPFCIARRVLTTPLQSLTTQGGLQSSKARSAHHGHKFSTKDRLPAARQRQPDTFSSIGHVANSTPAKVGVAA
eukprot:1941370-Amphidinium_carterae.1